MTEARREVHEPPHSALQSPLHAHHLPQGVHDLHEVGLRGHDVVDRGCAPESALATPGAAVRVGEDARVSLWWHGAPLVPEAQLEIARMVATFDVVTGEGSLVVERA